MTKYFNEVSQEEINVVRSSVIQKIDSLNFSVQKIRKGNISLQTQKNLAFIQIVGLIGIVIYLWEIREQVMLPYLLSVFQTNPVQLVNPYNSIYMIKDDVFWAMYSFVILYFVVDIIACVFRYFKLNKLIGLELNVLLFKSDYEKYLKNLDQYVDNANRLAKGEIITQELSPVSDQYLKDIESNVNGFNYYDILKLVVLIGGLLTNCILHAFIFETNFAGLIFLLLISMSATIFIIRHAFVYYIFPFILVITLILIL